MMKTSSLPSLSAAVTVLLYLLLVPFLVLAEPIPVIKYVQCPNSTIANDPIILQGKRFYNSKTGDYFPVKGIAYYPRPNEGSLSTDSNSVDFFTEEFRPLWEADIAHLQTLGVNTIRIYAVDPSQNHDGFMCALQQAGIHVIVGLLADCDGCAIGPNEAPSCYPVSLKERGQWIINEFSKYANTLAFSAGNEVTLYSREYQQIQINAACQKKFLRDMRAYVSGCSENVDSILPRKVPIGMVNWDFERERQSLYFNCQTNTSDALEPAEWYGLNAYQHCDPNDLLVGWYQMMEDFASYNLPGPVLIAEFGCRERAFPTMSNERGEFEAQRTWLQVEALYSELYQNVFAGGCVFEFSSEKLVADTSAQGNPWPYNGFMKLNYGVGYYSPIECDHRETPCQYNTYPEFDGLRDRLAAVDTSFVPNLANAGDSNAGQIPQCPEGIPAVSDFVWPVDDEPDLPCYLVATLPPTPSPTTAAPTNEPSAAPTGPPGSPTAPPTTSSDDEGELPPPPSSSNGGDAVVSASLRSGYSVALLLPALMMPVLLWQS